MKKRIKILVFITLITLLTFVALDFFNLPTKINSIINQKFGLCISDDDNLEWYDRYKVIAHAMGEIDGKDYTNSLEAMQFNYKRGSRVFEVDVSLTSDNQLVLVHGWFQHSNDRINKPENGGYPLSYEDFMKSKIYGEYTPLDFDDLLNLMIKYPDIHIVLDAKYTRKFALDGDYNAPELLNDQVSILSYYDRIYDSIQIKDKSLFERIIVQVYSPDMYKVINDKYKFKHYIYTLYMNYMNTNGQEIINFTVENNIEVIAMELGNESLDSIHDKLIASKNDDFKLYGFTYNSMDDYIKLTNELGFDGIFSDFIQENERCR